MSKKKISINDVAKRAGVSITTVSRVLNKATTVTPDNVARVEEAIAFLKFRPNVSAQRLASGANQTMGLVMPGYPGIFHSFYAIELIRGVGHACETLRMDLLFHITDGNRALNTSNFGGVIFADIIENRKQVESAIEDHVPCMVLNNVAPELETSYIGIDNYCGGRKAAEYLMSLGHTRVATITGNVQTQGGADRFHGFLDAMKTASLNVPETYIYKGDYSRRCARAAVEGFLALPERPTAIFAASDDMAMEAIAALMEHGLKVPEDISIIGFDDNPQALYGPIGLTTIQQPLFSMAETAVRELHAQMSGKSETLYQKVLEPTLIVRDSCAPLTT